MTSPTDARPRPASTPAERVSSFGRLSVAWDPRVLEPRPWTAAQSDWAADLLTEASEGAVLELFAGVGHIGQLAVAGNARRLVCVDLSPVACEYARRNARRNGLHDRVEVRCGAIATAVAPRETYALVIADPPWVPTGEVSGFPEDPRLAIDGGSDGLDLARESLAVAAGCLRPGGCIVLQLGTAEQVEALRGLVHGLGLEVAQTRTFARGILVLLVDATTSAATTSRAAGGATTSGDPRPGRGPE